jgi:hypothetical protein
MAFAALIQQAFFEFLKRGSGGGHSFSSALIMDEANFITLAYPILI